MVSHPLLEGIVLGFAIAAPVGPIGLLCIGRTLTDGRLVGFITGLGAATADALYGAVAAFGLTSLSGFLIGHQAPIRVFGGLFLGYLGIRTFLAKPPGESGPARSTGLSRAYTSTLLLTLTNPMTILSFAAIYAGLGVGARWNDLTSALMLILGVFAGSASWWFLLSGGVSLLRDRFTWASLVWVNRAAGLLVLAFGVAAILSVV